MSGPHSVSRWAGGWRDLALHGGREAGWPRPRAGRDSPCEPPPPLKSAKSACNFRGVVERDLHPLARTEYSVVPMRDVIKHGKLGDGTVATMPRRGLPR